VDTWQIGERHDIDFACYFAEELYALDALRADGLVERDARFVRATLRGRPLLRVIAMSFDAHLCKPRTLGGFSRAH